MERDDALQIAKQLEKNLKKIIPNFKMRLFGSFARGEQTHESDIDIYIEIPNKYYYPEIRDKVSDLAWEISFSNDAMIQTNVYSDKEVWGTPRRSSPFIQSIMKEGILI